MSWAGGQETETRAWWQRRHILLHFENRPDLPAVSAGTSELSHWGTLPLIRSGTIPPGQRLSDWYHLRSKSGRRKKANQRITSASDISTGLILLNKSECVQHPVLVGSNIYGALFLPVRKAQHTLMMKLGHSGSISRNVWMLLYQEWPTPKVQRWLKQEQWFQYSLKFH